MLPLWENGFPTAALSLWCVNITRQWTIQSSLHCPSFTGKSCKVCRVCEAIVTTSQYRGGKSVYRHCNISLVNCDLCSKIWNDIWMRWSGLYSTLRFQIIPKIVLVTEIDKRVFCDVIKKIGSTEMNKM